MTKALAGYGLDRLAEAESKRVSEKARHSSVPFGWEIQLPRAAKTSYTMNAGQKRAWKNVKA